MVGNNLFLIGLGYFQQWLPGKEVEITNTHGHRKGVLNGDFVYVDDIKAFGRNYIHPLFQVHD